MRWIKTRQKTASMKERPDKTVTQLTPSALADWTQVSWSGMHALAEGFLKPHQEALHMSVTSGKEVPGLWHIMASWPLPAGCNGFGNRHGCIDPPCGCGAHMIASPFVQHIMCMQRLPT